MYYTLYTITSPFPSVSFIHYTVYTTTTPFPSVSAIDNTLRPFPPPLPRSMLLAISLYIILYTLYSSMPLAISKLAATPNANRYTSTPQKYVYLKRPGRSMGVLRADAAAPAAALAQRRDTGGLRYTYTYTYTGIHVHTYRNDAIQEVALASSLMSCRCIRPCHTPCSTAQT